jgi:hypothetical protein
MDSDPGYRFSQRALHTVQTLLRNGSHHEIDLMLLLAVDLLASRYDVNDLILFIWGGTPAARQLPRDLPLTMYNRSRLSLRVQIFAVIFPASKKRNDICLFE